MDELFDLVSTTSPSTFCQAFFLLAALGVLSLNVLPEDVRGTLMDYGARRRATTGTGTGTEKQSRERTRLMRLLGKVTSYGQIPHSWFWHFYLLSTGLSAFWAWQYLVRGSVMALLAEKQARGSSAEQPSTELGRVFLAWTMMASQGSRRLFECFFVSKPGRTPMWIVHWALALAFYAAMSVAVWVEGSGDILESWHSQKRAVLLTTRVPSTLAVFFAAWLQQNKCHRYLAQLKKYTLPDEGLFKYIVCPHYTCECVIYLAISVMAAPPGSFFNTSVLCGLVFVAVNLGATALGTKQWYAGKFGDNKVANKWRMIPGIF
ncbi:hypothetical protein EsDP_00003197 [Epichloe bromicola]|uniref:Polyprenal reductase n=1 Tax=Epichloe bromicola TaxID=79588 RepID=A0ABQ0CNI7_9HYPO